VAGTGRFLSKVEMSKGGVLKVAGACPRLAVVIWGWLLKGTSKDPAFFCEGKEAARGKPECMGEYMRI